MAVRTAGMDLVARRNPRGLKVEVSAFSGRLFSDFGARFAAFGAGGVIVVTMLPSAKAGGAASAASRATASERRKLRNRVRFSV